MVLSSALEYARTQATGLLDRGYQLVRGVLVPTEEHAVAVPQRGRRGYHAATTGYRTDGWTSANGADANSEVLNDLSRLRMRSRDLIRNTPYALRAKRAWSSNMVSTGIRPLPNTGDKAVDKRIADLWAKWSKVCSPSNRSTIYRLQALAVDSWFESGELFARPRMRRLSDMPAGVPPLQIQLLESDHVPLDDLVLARLPGGNRVEMGIELDRLDRRVAYYVYRNHPGSSYRASNPSDLVRVPADQMIHLYEEARPGQMRGVPLLAAVMLALWDLAGYQGAERVRARANALVAAIVTGGEEPSSEDDAPESIAGPHDDENGGYLVDPDGNPIDQLKPGMVAYAPGGKQIQFNQPGTPGGYSDYIRAQLREIAAATGLSYETLTGDLGTTSFSSIKVGWQEQHRFIRMVRETIFIPFFLDPIYEAFIDASVVAGLLPDDPAVYKVKWSRPHIQSIDRKADAEAALTERRAGFRSQREIVASDFASDPDDVFEEMRTENEQLDDLGLVLDTDPRKSGKAGAGSAPAAEPTPTPAEETPAA